MTKIVPVVASRDLTVEPHPANVKNLVCVGCLLDPNRRNTSFPKLKLDRHLAAHAAAGHQTRAAA